ncbi:uncharacterized protein LOC110735437 [Chenopodium quinoa]|uniref:uncharacterized protein LOC110735437 n=1 Tax=Chenopodium quinoa TaxID=63459 RepID=UPI000B7870E7|nr:uncharacterized protein LOC110735437 [Chenopodium quinoa]
MKNSLPSMRYRGKVHSCAPPNVLLKGTISRFYSSDMEVARPPNSASLLDITHVHLVPSSWPRKRIRPLGFEIDQGYSYSSSNARFCSFDWRHKRRKLRIDIWDAKWEFTIGVSNGGSLELRPKTDAGNSSPSLCAVNTVASLFQTTTPSFVTGIDAEGQSGGLVVLGWGGLAISCVSKTPNFVHCDFNQLELLEDKLGGTSSIRGSDVFSNWKLQNHLLDVPFSEPRYTWTNKRLTQGLILERLDMGYMSNDWFYNFPASRIINQPLVASDHAAIVFDNDAFTRIAKRPYQVENWCLHFQDIRTIIEEKWKKPIAGSPMYYLTRKLVALRGRLRHWCLKNTKLWGVNWKVLTSELELDSLAATNIPLAHSYLNHVEEALTTAALNVTYWKQRMEETWEATGDIPTSLLYSRVKMRQCGNQVLTLKDDSGTWIEDRQQVRDLVVDSMTKVLCPQQGTNSAAHTDALLRELDIPTMSDRQVAILTRPFSADEILRAMFSLNGDKCPGPDGFTAAFFQKHWDTLGKSVILAVQSFFNIGFILREWNHSILVMIPKVEIPEVTANLRPINLCNTVYKYVSKCLVNRLKKALPDLISQSQHAFITG